MTNEKSNERPEEIVNDSRRSFVKKGVLASSALAFGVAGSDTITAAGSNQQADQAAVFAYDYSPSTSFQVVASLEENVVDAILGHQVNNESIIDDPAEYNGYVVLYQQNGTALGECALAFTRDVTLQENQQYQFGTDAMTFVPRANLLEAMFSSAGGETTTTEEGTTTTEAGATTAEEETATTAEEGTPTPTEGEATTTTEGTATTEGETTTTTEEGEAAENGGEEAELAVVFAYDYNPGIPFEVVASLDEDVVDAILGTQVDDESIVADPAEYNGYVIYYQQDGDTPGEFALVFTHDATLQEDQQYQFSTDAMTFRDQANLIEARLSAVGDGEATTTTEEGTTTTEEGTTTAEGETTTTTTEGEATTTTEEGTATEEGTTTEETTTEEGTATAEE